MIQGLGLGDDVWVVKVWKDNDDKLCVAQMCPLLWDRLSHHDMVGGTKGQVSQMPL